MSYNILLNNLHAPSEVLKDLVKGLSLDRLAHFETLVQDQPFRAEMYRYGLDNSKKLLRFALLDSSERNLPKWTDKPDADLLYLSCIYAMYRAALIGRIAAEYVELTEPPIGLQKRKDLLKSLLGDGDHILRRLFGGAHPWDDTQFFPDDIYPHHQAPE